MKKVVWLIVLVAFSFGCSGDNAEPEVVDEGTYLHFKVDGNEISLAENVNMAKVAMYENGESTLYINSGVTIPNSLGVNRLGIRFNKDGVFYSASLESQSNNGALSLDYNNYFNFPSNYFDFKLISIDTTAKIIKGSFKGKLYLDNFDLDSEYREIEANFRMEYEVITGTTGVGAYHCDAKFNGITWKGLRESPMGTFTSSDPYKIEFKFPQSANPDSFTLDFGNPNNYVKFSKFNTVTRTYDYYDLKGVVAFSHKEHHGSYRYTLIGTYSFEAVNPANPADVIVVTDGQFKTYQQY